MKRFWIKIISVIMLAMLAVSMCFSTVSVSASADDVELVGIEGTTIAQDLADVNELLYPKNVNGTHQLIRFQEYLFSRDETVSKGYGLYFYIYNPTEYTLREDDVYHSANMAVAYDANGEPTEYENVKLTYVDRTNNCRFYKFKLTEPARFLTLACAYADAHNGERRYDIAGIQLYYNATDKLEDEGVTSTYYFSGFAKGCSEATSEKSTLSARVEKLEVITTAVQHTNYRTGDYIDYVCDEVNTVYFSVPETYFVDYGGLQKIKAEWYEYKTKPIFVTSDSSAYNDLYPYVNVDIGDFDKNLKWRVLWSTTEPTGLVNAWIIGNSYNGWAADFTDIQLFGGRLSCLDWLFLREDVETHEDYRLSEKELQIYMENYTSRFSSQNLLNGYAESLFAERIDEERVELLDDPEEGRGYVVQEIDADKTEDLLVKVDKNWWSMLWTGVDYETAEYTPILTFSQTDLKTLEGMTDETFCETYFVRDPVALDADDEVQTVREYCIAELKAGNRPVLFRFAKTEYYASTARFDYIAKFGQSGSGVSDADGYVAQETMFLNFDMISLGFRNDNGVEKVIACVQTPFDIINGLEAPAALDPEADKQASQITALIALVLVVVVCAVVMILLYVYARPVFDEIWKIAGVLIKGLWNGLVFIVSLPFRCIFLIKDGVTDLNKGKKKKK